MNIVDTEIPEGKICVHWFEIDDRKAEIVCYSENPLTHSQVIDRIGIHKDWNKTPELMLFSYAFNIAAKTGKKLSEINLLGVGWNCSMDHAVRELVAALEIADNLAEVQS